ncbi:hypothetical protein BOTBODRAFT_189769 [Botryobasidium botryosum FD-172 SS1]|uniref:Major facilitator superfamily (MFS) profile domain-containing protein n=1 Tax=Botryobasidium botryosum (strain FD-172 SS1) TaxID=930990 RepID=A0A067MI60_BOTB1|nr:hypothetical protein BOTBODRAFT_189769 [Botryobasidium botryosum FD-172 SS1]
MPSSMNLDLERQTSQQQEASLLDSDANREDKEKDSSFRVASGAEDTENPLNWGRAKRWYLTFAGGLLTLNATFASSAPTGYMQEIMQEWHMGSELAALLISLFVTGYCIGPLLWGPLSEQYGRRPIFIVSFFVYACMQMACALAPSPATLLVFRFLGGTFAAGPLTNSAAILADIWDTSTRGKAMMIFTLAPFTGPAVGPLVSGYMQTAGVPWRWLFWVLAIFAGACFVVIVFTMPETYPRTILAQKAARMRKEMGDSRYWAPIERVNIHWKVRVSNILARPFKILFQEPMLIAIALYMSFVFGCVYLLFEAYPIVFTIGHRFSSGASGLMFVPFFLGCFTAVLAGLFYLNPRYRRQMIEYSALPVPPERRLEMAYVGGPMIVIAFLWFGWTSDSNISFWASMMSGVPLGVDVILIFLNGLDSICLSRPRYSTIQVVDAYLMVAASALVCNTVARSLAAAGFPLFANQMYDRLGTKWAPSLVGLIALGMLPISFVLARYGAGLRARSKHAPTKY